VRVARGKKSAQKKADLVRKDTKNVFFEKNTNSKKNLEKSRQIGGF
jgi:hypothetical protein